MAGTLSAKPIVFHQLKRIGIFLGTILAREKKHLSLAQIMQRLVAIRIGAMTHHASGNSFDVRGRVRWENFDHNLCEQAAAIPPQTPADFLSDLDADCWERVSEVASAAKEEVVGALK
jgi:hypothetical protein